jgi:hypothetical protein
MAADSEAQGEQIMVVAVKAQSLLKQVQDLLLLAIAQPWFICC